MLLSGIATETARWVAAAGPDLAVCDTRKTMPGLRTLSKYAVRVGGGTNHREGLFDMVLVKDNHIAAAAWHQGCSGEGDVPSTPNLLVEVEADTAEQAAKPSRQARTWCFSTTWMTRPSPRRSRSCDEAATRGRASGTDRGQRWHHEASACRRFAPLA